MNETTALLTRHKLSVDDYYRMAEVGILGWGDRVELIDGEIIDMAPIGVAHASIVGRITRALVLACGDKALVWAQNPVRLDKFNEAQPDFAVLRPRADFYATQHPGPADVLLLVEVGDSSLRYDRDVKLPMYARASVPEVWIVDLRRRLVRSHRQPVGEHFTADGTYEHDATIPILAAPGIAVRVNDLIGVPQQGA